MSRKIKFRVWDKRQQSFVDNWLLGAQGMLESEGKDTCFGHGSYGKVLSIKSHYDSPISMDQYYIPQQFTGLLDKNKKEIYEGDIIKYNKKGGICSDDEIYVSCIGYDDEEFKIPILCFHNQSIPINSWNYLFYTFEIIGNILENPQLLTKQQ